MSTDILTATSLDDLADVQVDVDLMRPDGRVVKVPMRALPESEIFELRKRIEWPKPPTKDFTKSGPVLDYNDKAYLEAMRDSNRRLMYLVLLHCLRITVPGATDDEKITALQARLGNYAYAQLVEASNRLNVVSEEDLAALARSFRPVGVPQSSGDGEAGDGAVSLVESAEG